MSTLTTSQLLEVPEYSVRVNYLSAVAIGFIFTLSFEFHECGNRMIS